MQTKLILTVACLITAFSLGDAQLASGAPSDAAAAAKRKVGIDTTFGDVVGRAQEAYRKKDYRRAVAGYTAALEMRPDKKNASELLLSRGNAYEWLGANQRALADYNEAIRLTPNDAEARGIRGDLLVTLDRPSDAVADLTEAIRKRPADIQAYSARGRAYLDLGQRDRARADFERVVRAPATTGVGYENRANANASLGNYRAAAADFAVAKRLLPGDVGVLNNSAWVKATCRDSSVRNGRAAVADATRACELTNWNDASTLDTLAAAYAEAGDFSRAIKFATQALSLSHPRRGEMEQHLQLFRQGKPVREEPKVER
jgi:tetratricopeptide (TPR) repeat protein